MREDSFHRMINLTLTLNPSFLASSGSKQFSLTNSTTNDSGVVQEAYSNVADRIPCDPTVCRRLSKGASFNLIAPWKVKSFHIIIIFLINNFFYCFVTAIVDLPQYIS